MEGLLLIDDGKILILSNDGSARICHVVMTNKTDRPMAIIRMDVMRTDGMRGKNCTLYKYTCSFVQQPKTICGIPVCFVDGKFRQYRKHKNQSFEIQFITVSSCYEESNLNHKGGVHNG